MTNQELFNSDRDKFLEFHHSNPEIWKAFERFTFQVINSGRKNYSANAIISRVRWDTDLKTTDKDFKINNMHIGHYARLFMMAYPEHTGFFRIRELKK